MARKRRLGYHCAYMGSGKYFVFTLFFVASVILSGCSYYSHLKKGSFEYSGEQQELDLDYNKRLLFVEVMINGKKKRFILDSGAPNVIDKSIQDEFDFKRIGSIGVNDVGGRTNKMDYVKIPELGMGTITIRNTVAIVGDFSHFTCYGIDGIIGTNIMSHFDWKLDYANEKAYLYSEPIDPESLQDFRGPISMQPNQQFSPYIPMAVHDQESSNTLIDLGSAGAISLKKWKGFNPESFVDHANVFGVSSIGMHGAVNGSANYVRLELVRFGDIDAGSSWGKASETSGFSIGNGFLENFDVVMSWKSHALYLRAVDEPEIELPDQTLYLGYSDSGAYIKAYSTGLTMDAAEIGDRIDELNGAPMQNITEEEFCDILEKPLEEVSISVLGSPEDVIYYLDVPKVKY